MTEDESKLKMTDATSNNSMPWIALNFTTRLKILSLNDNATTQRTHHDVEAKMIDAKCHTCFENNHID